MLSRLKITNYRGFESFELGNLTAVNLIVGKNNSGKTALLEAIHFLASGGNPAVLTGVANRRNEYIVGEEFEGTDDLIDISHFFHGHEVCAGSEIAFAGDNDLPAVRVKAVATEELDNETLFQLREFAAHRQGGLWDSPESPILGMKIEGGGPSAIEGRTFLLSESGALLRDPRRRSQVRPWIDEKRESPRIAYIAPDASMSESLAKIWDYVLREKREADVQAAMRILEPDLDDIVFQAASTSRYRPRPGILIGFKQDLARRVPLGSLGDGMRRLLGLSLSLLHARAGYLLIDEIDTGFHYSVMAKMWELVVKTAASSRTQVFATTHSADCVRGLGVLCKRSPELRGEVSTHKIERDLSRSVHFSGEEILSAVEEDVEIR